MTNYLENIAFVSHPMWNHKRAKSNFAQNSRIWDILPIANYNTDIGEAWDSGVYLELDLLDITTYHGV